MEFLNAVADADPYGLYDSTNMLIDRAGVSPSYNYTSQGGYESRPVRWVSWYNAARFVNWMENGQPTGAQGVSTTEKGVHDLTGGTLAQKSTRVTGANWFLPDKDEWYKAAMHP